MKIFKKRLNNRGFSHIELFFAVIVVAVVAGAGFYVYKHQNKAHAAGWTRIASRDGVTASVCKTYVNAYGGVYNVTAQFYRPSGTSTQGVPYDLVVYRNGNFLTEKFGSTYWANTMAQVTVGASAYYNDKVQVVINGGYNRGGPTTYASSQFLPKDIQTC